MTKRPPIDIVLVEPATQTLFTRSKDSLWPPSILDNHELAQEVNMRQKLYASLKALFANIPDPNMDLGTAIDEGRVRGRDVLDLFTLLTALLESDPNNRRLLLYLPFALIPDLLWTKRNDALAQVYTLFAEPYMRHWKLLLEKVDVRANFVIGDILEPELAPNGQPLVHKAAHLIPMLVLRGLMTTDDVQHLHDNASTDTLEKSIADALSVLLPESPAVPKKRSVAHAISSLEQLTGIINNGLRQIEVREALDLSRNMPIGRVAWEKINNTEKLIASTAETAAAYIMKNHTSWSSLQFFINHRAMDLVRLSVVRAVRIAAVTLVETDRTYAHYLASNLFTTLDASDSNTPQLGDEIETALGHLLQHGLATDADYLKFGHRLPQLDAPFDKGSDIARELRGFEAEVQTLQNDPSFARLFYPVILFFGSRLKGYAKRNADLDAAVFIRPDIDPSERPFVRDKLLELFPSKKIDGKMVEFWLTSQGDELWIRDFPEVDIFLGDSTWIHLIMGSVWLGEATSVTELYEKLLSSFLKTRDATFMGHNLRRLWLDELEREVLQYRLMHKGYRRLFPPHLRIPESARRLDPESAFWDEGYRRLATCLYVSRVFVPQI
jgi:hypothetical protein